MISIAVLSSVFRLQQLDDLLKLLPKNQEIFVVYDDIKPVRCDIDYIVVKRRGRFYCRADVWHAAVNRANYDRILLLDGDRVPHPDFITHIINDSSSDLIHYPTSIINLGNGYKPCDIITAFTLSPDEHRLIAGSEAIGPRRNPMSGCVSFTKSSYHKWGGMSPEFVGWGFNDIDCYCKALKADCKFMGHMLPEVHLYHDYEVSRFIFMMMNAYNGVKFYHKWCLSIHPLILGTMEKFNCTVYDALNLSLSAFIEKASMRC